MATTWPLVTVGVYEAVMWGFDPFQVHTALNGRFPMSIAGRLAAASVNGGLWILLAHAFRRRKIKTVAALAPFAAAFTFNQWIFWWWPYLLGQEAGTAGMVHEHTAQLAHLPRLLPAIGDHLVPSIEHTLLLPISLFALGTVLGNLSKMRGSLNTNANRILRVSGVLFSALPIGFLLRSPAPLAEVGPLLAMAQVGLTVLSMIRRIA